MGKHFEDLWEESELLLKDELPILLDDLVLVCDQFKEDLTIDSFGQILFLLCGISKNLDINAYEALQSVINDHRTKILDAE